MNLKEKHIIIDKQKVIVTLIILGSIAAALKCIFVSLQMDEEYAISMPYRLFQGDRLLTQLWDPHQTSAFLIEFLIWVFVKIFHTTTYLVIWIRFWGVMMQLGVTICLYRTIRGEIDRSESFYLAAIYFNLLPKGYAMPEFSNMMAWGLTLLLICLTKVSQMEKKGCWNKKTYLLCIGAGICLCFVVLSYPTCALLYPFLMIYLWKYDSCRKKTMWIITLTCVLFGSLYLGNLLSYMSLQEMFQNIHSLISSNAGAHPTNKLIALGIYAEDFLVLGIYAGIFCCVTWLIRKIFHKKNSRLEFMYTVLIVAFCYEIMHWVLMLWHYERSYPYVVYFFLLFFGIYAARGLRKENAEERASEMAFLWIGTAFVMLLAILMLTNLTIATSVKYLMPGVIAAMLLLISYTKKNAPEIYKKYAIGVLLLWCFTAIFVKGWAYPDNDGLMKNITCVGNIIGDGPAKGIVTEYMQGYMQESNYEEFRTYIMPGQNLLVMDSNTLCYLYQDVKVAGSSTICSPTFDANLLDYWKRNPDHYPDVIAVPCWYGELKVDKNSWMMQWIDRKFGATKIIDGKYFRYYICER